MLLPEVGKAQKTQLRFYFVTSQIFLFCGVAEAALVINQQETNFWIFLFAFKLVAD